MKAKLLTSLLCLSIALISYGQKRDDNDRQIRENPVIDYSESEIGVSVPSFIKRNLNQITLNGADWSHLSSAFKNVNKAPASIVHIGDSHLQADIMTGMVRDLLQYDYGNAGRGLIVPHKMTGSNQASDYTITGTGNWESMKLMKQPWNHTMGFTGVTVKPSSDNSSISISTKENDYDYNPFSSITLFHNGKLRITRIENLAGSPIAFVSTPSQNYTHIDLKSEQTAVKIIFESAGDLTIYGANLSGNRPGVFYHTIGNNGATFDSYNRIGREGIGIAPLKPNLVILSLGNNEAFGKFNEATFTKAMTRLIDNIKKANPNAAILLVTPMECQKSVTSTTSHKTKGKKRKTTTKKSYAPNSNILPIRNAILKYAKSNHIPVYDWYAVAGGEGASNQWIANNLFSNDRIHLSSQGYNLAGLLLYEALKNAIK